LIPNDLKQETKHTILEKEKALVLWKKPYLWCFGRRSLIFYTMEAKPLCGSKLLNECLSFWIAIKISTI
jgi:hypothetical protein